MKIITYILVLPFVFGVILGVSAQNQSRYGGSFARGVELFYAKDYAGAVREFEKAEVDNPGNHAAYLWHGLAYTALGEMDIKAANVWLKMPYDEKWKSTSRFFMGLGYWQRGETGNAKYWFNEAIKHPETPAAKLAQTALKSLLDDGEAPTIETWATLASLPGAKSIDDKKSDSNNTKNYPAETEQSQTAPKNNPVRLEKLLSVLQNKSLTEDAIIGVIQKNGVNFQLTKALELKLRNVGASDYLISEAGKNYRAQSSNTLSNASTKENSNSSNSGAKPSGGLWRGTISNGYTGQKISFRVSADGKTISGITFQGYLRCRSTFTPTQDTRLAPLENVSVAGGAFSKMELQDPQIRFDFKGTFDSATTASGTYRIQSGTDCDTYELKWTAARVGQ